MDKMAMGAVGNVATGSKTTRAKELTDFRVKRGDNGGLIVCETYRSAPPEGRRTGASFPEESDYQENPFSPGDRDAALSHIADLLGQMAGEDSAAPEPAASPVAPPDDVPPQY